MTRKETAAASEHVANIEKKSEELKELKTIMEGIESRIEQVESEILDSIDAFLESRKIQRMAAPGES